MSNAPATQAQRPKFSVMISTPGYQKMINNTLKDPKRAQRFVASITSAVAVNPTLQECDPATILSGALLGESLGLSPSPQLGQYYLVPFWNKKNGCNDAVFCLGYRGLVQLALRSGYYKHLNVLPVKAGELISFNPLTEEVVLHLNEDELAREASATIGYIATFEYLNGFRKTIYWSKDKMMAHADRYSQAFSVEAQTITRGKNTYKKVSFSDYEAGNYPKQDEWLYSSFWYKDFDAMACKTMLRQLISKWGVMSIDLQTAFEADSVVEADVDYIQAQDPELPPAMDVDTVPEAEVEQAETPPNEEQVSLSDV